MFEQPRSRIGRLWCTLVHDSPMWPVHGYYECRICGRRYPAFVEWAYVSRVKRGVLQPMPVSLAWHGEGGKQ